MYYVINLLLFDTVILCMIWMFWLFLIFFFLSLSEFNPFMGSEMDSIKKKKTVIFIPYVFLALIIITTWEFEEYII